MIVTFKIGLAIFFGIPLIALFDYMIFMPYFRQQVKDLKKYERISVLSWLPACFIESLVFIAGIMIGYFMR